MSITVEGTVIMRAGKICYEAIAQLPTEQLKRFLILHALAPYPELLEEDAVQVVFRVEPIHLREV